MSQFLIHFSNFISLIRNFRLTIKTFFLFAVFFNVFFALIYLNAYKKNTDVLAILVNSSKNFIQMRDYLSVQMIALQYSKTDLNELLLRDKNNEKLFEINFKDSFFKKYIEQKISSGTSGNYDYILISSFSLSPLIFLAILLAILFTFSLDIYLFFLSMKEKQKLEIEFKMKKYEEVSRIALELSHDIRSPLAALGIVLDVEDNISNENRECLVYSINRINDIANNLLSKHRGILDVKKMINIYDLLSNLLSEKKLIYQNKDDLNIVLVNNITREQEIEVHVGDISRVFSNLINNSIEAQRSGEAITIEISIDDDGDKVKIQIKDNGKGIPASIIKKLGKENISYEKRAEGSGHGLGMTHAFKVINEHDGEIDIQSKVNVGTIITVLLPRYIIDNENKSN